MSQDAISLMAAIMSIFLLPLVAYYVFKDTVFDITFIRKNPWPML